MTTSSFKIIALREQPLAAALATCAAPAQIARYWRRHSGIRVHPVPSAVKNS